ncbi:translation initiation factor Sui1 [Desulfuromonas carbonis]|uniref:translation initiation factor Sui1 n=1 Tax=Desulfuromonas sp. DDH964 TaxID=1823759 RepID=UPI00078EE8A9|nr:translation initiation factor Sui1 [Desulfuromonas sp. DDH964]AMV73225.1 translation initiation factor Sui1 [Desulfuromonas sp. DDH964]
MKSSKTNSRLVYSSEQGRICPACEKPAAACSCSRTPEPPRGNGAVRVGRETKGRKGKGVTTISGLPLDEAGLDKLASELKKRCGCGGTVRDGVIEIQGDQRELLLAELLSRGWSAKKSGG